MTFLIPSISSYSRALLPLEFRYLQGSFTFKVLAPSRCWYLWGIGTLRVLILLIYARSCCFHDSYSKITLCSPGTLTVSISWTLFHNPLVRLALFGRRSFVVVVFRLSLHHCFARSHQTLDHQQESIAMYSFDCVLTCSRFL